MNQSINTGIVPDILKISCVAPTYKSGIETDPNNYQPISTSPFTKVLERLVYNQLQLFLQKYKILYDYQFGFRKGYSTEQAILELSDGLKTAIDNREITCGLFLDFSNAFDTVNHEILLSKLYKYGIRGTPLEWFKDYLTNRQQYVRIGNIDSEKLNITFYSGKSIDDVENVMNEELERIFYYCAVNKFMVITSQKKKIRNIRIRNFEQKDYINYLGIYIG